MNDYELIYMYRRNLDSDEIFNLLAKKYRSLICRIIYNYNRQHLMEQYVNEGLFVLMKALFEFDENRCKTFTRYLEERLKWHFISLVKEESLYVVKDIEPALDYLQSPMMGLEIPEYLNENEITLYEALFVNKSSIQELAIKLNKSVKSVYNLIYRLKTKIKSFEK